MVEVGMNPSCAFPFRLIRERLPNPEFKDLTESSWLGKTSKQSLVVSALCHSEVLAGASGGLSPKSPVAADLRRRFIRWTTSASRYQKPPNARISAARF